MALPSSGQITLKQIGSEFGTSPTLKSNYGKGGASSSGDITIKEFYGRSADTSNTYVYNGAPGFHRSGVGYSIDQEDRTSYTENGYALLGTAGYSLTWAGVYTTAGGDDYFGFDYEAGLATELGYWNTCEVTWGVGGFTANYGRYDWYTVNVGGYDFVILDSLYPSSITDQQGYSLYDYAANNWGFTVKFDQRL